MHTRARRSAVVALACGAVTVSCGSAPRGSSAAVAPPGEVVLSPAAIQAAGITTTEARPAEVRGEISVSGHVQAVAGAETALTAPFAGVFELPPGRSLPAPGETLAAGEPVGFIAQRLDATQSLDVAVRSAQARAQLEAAEHDVAYRESTYDRARRLLSFGGTSVAELQATAAALARARAARSEARRSLEALGKASHALVRSPRLSAVVVPLRASVLAVEAVPGAQVAAGATLFRVADTTRTWVEGALFEGDLAAVDPQAPALALLPGVPEPRRVAPVALGPAVDPDTLAAPARYLLENGDGRAHVGMSATLLLPLRRRLRAVLVPAESIVTTGTSRVAYVDRGDGHYAEREVDVCQEWPLLSWAAPASAPGEDPPAHPVAVCSGLPAGAHVVVHGAALLWGESELTRAPPRPEEERE